MPLLTRQPSVGAVDTSSLHVLTDDGGASTARSSLHRRPSTSAAAAAASAMASPVTPPNPTGRSPVMRSARLTPGSPLGGSPTQSPRPRLRLRIASTPGHDRTPTAPGPLSPAAAAAAAVARSSSRISKLATAAATPGGMVSPQQMRSPLSDTDDSEANDDEYTATRTPAGGSGGPRSFATPQHRITPSAPSIPSASSSSMVVRASHDAAAVSSPRGPPSTRRRQIAASMELPNSPSSALSSSRRHVPQYLGGGSPRDSGKRAAPLAAALPDYTKPPPIRIHSMTGPGAAALTTPGGVRGGDGSSSRVRQVQSHHQQQLLRRHSHQASAGSSSRSHSETQWVEEPASPPMSPDGVDHHRAQSNSSQGGEEHHQPFHPAEEEGAQDASGGGEFSPREFTLGSASSVVARERRAREMKLKGSIVSILAERLQSKATGSSSAGAPTSVLPPPKLLGLGEKEVTAAMADDLAAEVEEDARREARKQRAVELAREKARKRMTASQGRPMTNGGSGGGAGGGLGLGSPTSSSSSALFLGHGRPAVLKTLGEFALSAARGIHKVEDIDPLSLVESAQAQIHQAQIKLAIHGHAVAALGEGAAERLSASMAQFSRPIGPTPFELAILERWGDVPEGYEHASQASGGARGTTGKGGKGKGKKLGIPGLVTQQQDKMTLDGRAAVAAATSRAHDPQHNQHPQQQAQPPLREPVVYSNPHSASYPLKHTIASLLVQPFQPLYDAPIPPISSRAAETAGDSWLAVNDARASSHHESTSLIAASPAASSSDHLPLLTMMLPGAPAPRHILLPSSSIQPVASFTALLSELAQAQDAAQAAALARAARAAKGRGGHGSGFNTSGGGGGGGGRAHRRRHEMEAEKWKGLFLTTPRVDRRPHTDEASRKQQQQPQLQQQKSRGGAISPTRLHPHGPPSGGSKGSHPFLWHEAASERDAAGGAGGGHALENTLGRVRESSLLRLDAPPADGPRALAVSAPHVDPAFLDHGVAATTAAAADDDAVAGSPALLDFARVFHRCSSQARTNASAGHAHRRALLADCFADELAKRKREVRHEQRQQQQQQSHSIHDAGVPQVSSSSLMLAADHSQLLRAFTHRDSHGALEVRIHASKARSVEEHVPTRARIEYTRLKRAMEAQEREIKRRIDKGQQLPGGTEEEHKSGGSSMLVVREPQQATSGGRTVAAAATMALSPMSQHQLARKDVTQLDWSERKHQPPPTTTTTPPVTTTLMLAGSTARGGLAAMDQLATGPTPSSAGTSGSSLAAAGHSPPFPASSDTALVSVSDALAFDPASLSDSSLVGLLASGGGVDLPDRVRRNLLSTYAKELPERVRAMHQAYHDADQAKSRQNKRPTRFTAKVEVERR